MILNQQLLDILVCPKCKGSLSLVEGGRSILCDPCQLKYQVCDGVPIMIIEEAVDLRVPRQQQSRSVDPNLPAAAFKIVDGPNKGMVFHLERGTCKALGRTLPDANKTTMFNLDLTLALDESTKRLVQQYISKQFRKSSKVESKENLGSFRRTSDVVLEDSSISRLHAMVFYDDVGVGILDLVSKNGTYVNGQEVESYLLNKGDAIELGDSRIVFEG